MYQYPLPLLHKMHMLPELSLIHIYVVLSKDCSRSADRTQIEAAIFLTSIYNLLATVSFRQHNYATAVALEQLNIRVHTSGSCRAH